ncbi:hypothetical protein [Bifidobacterium miconisargentati]|uniref:hypothetical protein n=1 Tax=Bifidobacterium miconisargentati TaxID=2834437 RepID=UPI001BDBC854|nr:hypothetical protein [Bifidobacterium miconisargentati]MBW3091093.1 hypothetical protein [Bifidobacterium miconisargentati]
MKRNNKPNKRWIKLVGVLTAAALGLTYAGSALADDFTLPGTTFSDSSSSTWADQADGEVDALPDGALGDSNSDGVSSDSSDSSNAADSTGSSDSVATPSANVTPIDNCQDVQDWDALVSCVTKGQSGLVTITKTVTAPTNGAPTTIAGDITLTAAAGVDPALTSTTGDAIFVVNGGHTLTIGQDVNDASFSYKNAQRWLALVNKDDAGKTGALVINNGTFDSIKTPLTYEKDDTGNNHVRSDNGGSVAVNNGGTLTIKGGSFSNNSAANGGVFYQFSGSTTINNATFFNNTANEKDGQKGGVYYQNGGSLTINSGEFKSNKGYRGGVVYSDAGTITVHGGTFDGNSSNMAAGVFMQNSTADTMTVDGGTFTNNKAGTKGGAIHNNGTLTVSAGEFSGNSATGNGADQGGGAISQDKGSAVITGGTFSKNWTTNIDGLGGGAILQYGGTLTVKGGAFDGNVSANIGGAIGSAASLTVEGGTFSGNVALRYGGGAIFGRNTVELYGGTFKGNKQSNGSLRADGTVDYAICTTEGDPSHNCRKNSNSGGGAVRIDGDNASLTVQGGVTFTGNYTREWTFMSGGGAVYVKGKLWVRNDARGVKPLFDGNWAGVLDQQYEYVDGVKKVPVGGAGGAVFLQNGGSIAYFMGGEFRNNSSGYLGGAIYTEEGSMSYIAKAAATANHAGHFGGGFWLCPSGTGLTSKGGNIALYDNKVDASLDPNADNSKPSVHTAGDDFAIMNPWAKSPDNHNTVEQNSFQLMDTWFTDRTESAVKWEWNGQPIKEASGFGDSWQKGIPGDNRAVTAETKSGELTAPDGSPAKFDEHIYNLQLQYQGLSGYYGTGVALKAVVQGTQEEQQSRKDGAWSAAAVTFTNNDARLSGGAFGTNGNVL